MSGQKKKYTVDNWLNEEIMCGYPWPVTRREAASKMVQTGGFTWDEAIKALCWYRAVQLLRMAYSPDGC
jgi:hypothetical protein